MASSPATLGEHPGFSQSLDHNLMVIILLMGYRLPSYDT